MGSRDLIRERLEIEQLRRQECSAGEFEHAIRMARRAELTQDTTTDDDTDEY